MDLTCVYVSVQQFACVYVSVQQLACVYVCVLNCVFVRKTENCKSVKPKKNFRNEWLQNTGDKTKAFCRMCPLQYKSSICGLRKMLWNWFYMSKVHTLHQWISHMTLVEFTRYINGVPTWHQWSPDMTSVKFRHDSSEVQTWHQWISHITSMKLRHDISEV